MRSDCALSSWCNFVEPYFAFPDIQDLPLDNSLNNVLKFTSGETLLNNGNQAETPFLTLKTMKPMKKYTTTLGAVLGGLLITTSASQAATIVVDDAIGSNATTSVLTAQTGFTASSFVATAMPNPSAHETVFFDHTIGGFALNDTTTDDLVRINLSINPTANRNFSNFANAIVGYAGTNSNAYAVGFVDAEYSLNGGATYTAFTGGDGYNFGSFDFTDFTVGGTTTATSGTSYGTGNVAGADFNSQSYSFSVDVVAVPEPSSTALLGLGGLALILRRRK